MASSDADWTGKWVAEKMQNFEGIVSARVRSPQLVQLERRQMTMILVATTAVACVNADVLRPLLDSEKDLAFVVNVPKESFVAGDALHLAKSRGIPVGGLRDLMSAVALRDVRTYVSKEFRFIERGLQQHTRVVSYKRLDDRRYRVVRCGLEPAVVVFLNEYELTADHIRTARDRYGLFRLLVLTNPNGRVTSSAEAVAHSIGSQICNWAVFLGALNRK